MWCKGGDELSDANIYFTFDLITRSSSLNKQFYSNYQTVLHDIISEKIDNGMNYKEVADWLNENGYKTTRGHSFKNGHTHSIKTSLFHLREHLTKFFQRHKIFPISY